MLAAIADHLWQSCLCFLLGAALAGLAHHNAALVRLWIWRICALKFLLPFALVFALGQWLGIPLRHIGDPLPASLLRGAATVTPWLAPAQSAVLSRAGGLALFVGGLAAAVLCVQWSKRRQRIESWRAGEESGRIESAADDAPPALGFFKAAMFTSCAIWSLGIALVGGALDDGVRRHELLAEHVRALRDAPVFMAEAAPGMGTRSRLTARGDGILIRNINLQELIAVSYGVSHFAVSYNQMYPRDTDPDQYSSLLVPHYDVRIEAPIQEPGDFDPYALRQRVTRLIVDRFGIEIHVNGECQRPCGRWDTAAWRTDQDSVGTDAGTAGASSP